VYPAEVEAALRAHPDVVECAVLPWPDEELGQVGRAAVVTRRALREAELREHCRALLAAYKVPPRFVLLDQLPRTAAGKPDRVALRILLS
jgi:acyl-CoA synthetase (AMP-forming)/AMP-acid ligase II